MPDISLPLDWDKDTLRSAANMNSNDNALIAGLSDGTKDIACNNVTAPLIGNSSSASSLAAPVDIIIDGDFDGTAAYDGSADVNLSVTSDDGVAASCTISRKIDSAKMKVLHDHATDVDLDGNNTLNTWRNIIYPALGNPFMDGAATEYISNIFGNADAWDAISTTPLSASELTVMNTSNTGIEAQYKISSIENLAINRNASAADLARRETQFPIIINFDPSIGTNPHDFTLLSNIEFPSLGGDKSAYYDTALISDDRDQYISPAWQVSLQRNDELNPTHLQAVLHTTQNYIRYVDTFTGGLPTHPIVSTDNTDPMTVYWVGLALALSSFPTPGSDISTEMMDPPPANAFESNTTLFEEQAANGLGTFTDDYILRNVSGYFNIPALAATGAQLMAFPSYSASLYEYLLLMGQFHTYATTHTLMPAPELATLNTAISDVQAAYDLGSSGYIALGSAVDALWLNLDSSYYYSPIFRACQLPRWWDSDGTSELQQGKWAFPSNINITLFKR
tara:strand:- start:4916 stop:6439 length:1524 start_codon:yes stop_codon:yes gene_type:complete